MSDGSYPVRLDLRAPNRIANWRPLVHWLLVIPHLLVAYGLRVLRQVLTLVSLFTVLFTKQIPESIFNMIVMTRRYAWRATSYAFFMRESYPPFAFTATAEDDGLDPAGLSVEYPRELNRWLPLVKWLLAIPHYIVLIFLGIAAIIVVFPVAFFAVLFTGTFPEGLRDFVVGVQRWGMRVAAYVGLLRDEYPPFSLQNGEVVRAATAGVAGGPSPTAPVPPPPPPPPPPAG